MPSGKSKLASIILVFLTLGGPLLLAEQELLVPPPESLDPNYLPVKKRPNPEPPNPQKSPHPTEGAPIKEMRENPAGFTTTTDLSLLLITPLIKERTFEGRFTSFGGMLLFSLPVYRIINSVHLHMETGVNFTGAHVLITQPNLNFYHFYLGLPLRARVQFPTFHSDIIAEAFAGIQLDAFEYDSRSTTDGGFYFARDIVDNLNPDFGAGLSFRLNPSTKLRFILSYLFLGAGVVFQLS